MQQARDKLKINCAMVQVRGQSLDHFAVHVNGVGHRRQSWFLFPAFLQIPIGVESDCQGIVDVVSRKAYQFVGTKGTVVEEVDIPEHMKEEVSSSP